MDHKIIHSCGQAVLREIAGEYVLVPMGETALKIQKLICLTESSAMLWKMVSEGTTEQAMLQALLENYEVDADTAGTDLRKFLETMQEIGLIGWEEEHEPMQQNL